RLTLTN
ncbi:hypothetical protein D046_5634B, partial [Vibrio parahaemolyticus V-223/04]